MHTALEETAERRAAVLPQFHIFSPKPAVMRKDRIAPQQVAIGRDLIHEHSARFPGAFGAGGVIAPFVHSQSEQDAQDDQERLEERARQPASHWSHGST